MCKLHGRRHYLAARVDRHRRAVESLCESLLPGRLSRRYNFNGHQPCPAYSAVKSLGLGPVLADSPDADFNRLAGLLVVLRPQTVYYAAPEA